MVLRPKIIFSAVFLIVILALLFIQYYKQSRVVPIRIGILHSLSGIMAENEKPLIDTLLMAMDEINDKGGLLGRQLEAVIVDIRSEPDHAAQEVERLIKEEKIDVIFGCGTSACRKAVKPVVEKYNHILFYPIQYEGLEQSDNIIYTGSTPNQQIIPGVVWALKNFGSRIYLVGSDTIFPRTANFIIRDIANAKGAEIVAEQYQPQGANDFDKIISQIDELRPDVILSTINGNSNHAFFQKKHQAGLDDIPIISFSISEKDLAISPYTNVKSHYAVQSYFQNLDNPTNHAFVGRIKQRLGPLQPITTPMEASYIGLYLWTQAVRSAESTIPALVYKTISQQTMKAPQGVVSVESSHHLRKRILIGQANSKSHFDIIWATDHAIRPIPFPAFRNRSAWDKIITRLSNEGKN